MEEKTKSLIGLQASAILLSSIGIVAKMVSQPSQVMVFVRSFFAVTALFSFLKITKKPVFLSSKKDYFFLFLSGILFTLHIFFFFESVKYSSVAISLAAVFTYPLMLAFLEPYFSRQKLSFSSIILAVLALCGILIMVPSFELTDKTTQGIIYGVICALAFACSVILNKTYIKKYSEELVVSYQNLTAFLLLFPLVIPQIAGISLNDLLLLFFMGVVLNVGGYLLFYRSLRHVKAQTAGVISSMEPVYGALGALFLLNEIPTVRTVLGGLLIIGASIIASLQTKAQPPPE